MKLIGNIIIMVVVAFAGRFLYQKFVPVEKEAELPPGVEIGSRQHLLMVAAEINTTLPRKIDNDVTLTRVVGRERQLIYQGELANLSGKQVNSARFIAAVTPYIRKHACGNPKMKVFWKHDITATYRFIGNDQFGIGEVSVPAADCA